MLQLNADLLELLEANPEKFQQVFMVDQFHFNLSNSRQIHKNNEKLHLLVQQILLGLPIKPILQNYPQLAKWIDQLQPIINAPTEQIQTNAVYQKLLFKKFLLSTRFDLIMAGYEKTAAINWSTSDALDVDKLPNSWHTQLSLFLLTENEQVLPENVSVTYSSFTEAKSPTIYQFYYSQSQYDFFKKRLETTLLRLPIYSKSNEYFYSNNIAQTDSNLQKLASGELLPSAYLDTIPEVEI